jgi:vacuolar-type H+-ATPase subunit I/STV1
VNGLDFTIDAGTFAIGLLVQFVGIVWYSRGLVAELKQVIKKVDHLEQKMKQHQDKVDPVVYNFSILMTTLNESIRDIRAELKELRTELKSKENVR